LCTQCCQFLWNVHYWLPLRLVSLECPLLIASTVILWRLFREDLAYIIYTELKMQYDIWFLMRFKNVKNRNKNPKGGQIYMKSDMSMADWCTLTNRLCVYFSCLVVIARYKRNAVLL
jgi:hypothetical protein